MAVAVLLPTLGLASAAGAAPPPDSPAAMRARADKDSAAGFARIKAGGTASFDECATQAKPKPNFKGVTSCSRPSKVDPAEVAAMLADINRDLAADLGSDPTPPPPPAPGEPATAYGVAPGDGPPKTMTCPFDGTRFTGRMQSCSIYNFETIYVQIVNGRPAGEIGRSYQTAVEWDQLSSTSRSWTHHLTVRVAPYSYGDAAGGIYVWTAMRCSLPCHVSNESPANSWVWVPTSQNFYGSGTLGTADTNNIDYFQHNTNIYTKSRSTDPALYATALTLSPDEIRCDNQSYINGSKGCAYWKQPGYLTLSLSDPTITESANFVREAQGYLLNHPGVMGWMGLNRATPAQATDNEKARKPACDALKLVTPVPPGSPGLDCDEFPFRSTAQGAASGIIKLNWDIRMVNKKHNQLVGSKLSVFYGKERLFFGDHFYVQFTP